MRIELARRLAWLPAVLVLAASCSSGGTTPAAGAPTPVTGALTAGLIGYISDQGVGVLEPATGKSAIVAPLPGGGAFRVAGPVWGPAAGSPYPLLYFAVHDDRPAERRTSPGVVPYDWLFRVDPFTGVIEPLAASADLQSEGVFGLVGNAHYLAFSVGAGNNVEVDALDLTRPPGALKAVAKPPTQAVLFTEGAAPGVDGLLAVRAALTGAWYWLNPDAGVINPFPLPLGPDDGPIAISSDGTMAAVSLVDQGAVIEPINVAPPAVVASPAASATAAVTPPATASATPRPSTAPRKVNSKLPHADGLAWSPDAKSLALAVNGEVEIYNAAEADGTPATSKYLSGANVTGIDWSAPIAGQSLALVKPSGGPQALVDGLLEATKLPAAADTSGTRSLTKVFLWQFDSTKTSPIETIPDATPAVLKLYPALPAGPVFHHWAPSTTWGMLGGCYRYRVVITGSVPPTPSTFGLASNSPCSTATPSPSATQTPSATHSPSPSHSP